MTTRPDVVHRKHRCAQKRPTRGLNATRMRACIKSPLPLGGEGWVRGKTRGCLDVSPSPQPSPFKGEGALKHALEPAMESARNAGLPIVPEPTGFTVADQAQHQDEPFRRKNYPGNLVEFTPSGRGKSSCCPIANQYHRGVRAGAAIKSARRGSPPRPSPAPSTRRGPAVPFVLRPSCGFADRPSHPPNPFCRRQSAAGIRPDPRR
jgi:hypothetical protein